MHQALPRRLLPSGLHIIVGGEVGRLVASLSQHGGNDALVERRRSLLADDRQRRLHDVGIFSTGEGAGVDHRVELGLHADLTDLGRGHDQDGLRQAREEAGDEDRALTGAEGGRRCQHILKLLERPKPKGHFRHDPRVHRRQTLVQTREPLPGHDAPRHLHRPETGPGQSDPPRRHAASDARSGTRGGHRPSASHRNGSYDRGKVAAELHAGLDGVEGVADGGLDEARSSAG
mmetsp:Transcript_39664/g.92828  ORF Transcript_39664/g.92828 Transcript_39664/m.92828 type:complete len:232 (+) Transcript_39664:723-1418(+)